MRRFRLVEFTSAADGKRYVNFDRVIGPIVSPIVEHEEYRLSAGSSPVGTRKEIADWFTRYEIGVKLDVVGVVFRDGFDGSIDFVIMLDI